ncbi:MAG TPA: hypothetical protein VKP12_03215 [Kiloniellaceae bacterium]|nr:hypothetical protein [Kiloniellaceae bacterium]
MVKTSPGTDTIEDNINATRDSIGDKMERLQERLSPGDMFDSVIDFARSNGSAIASGVGNTVREHPLPIAMIGAGIVWLAIASRSRDEERDYYGDEREGTTGRLRRRAAAVGEGLRERASDLGERAGELSGKARDEAMRYGRSGGEFVRAHPVLVGAVGVALGAALAAALPRTSREDSVFGERAERARQAAKEAALREGRKVQEAAKAAVEKARETAERKAPTADDLKRDVERTAKAATGRASGTGPSGGPGSAGSA